MVDAFRIKDSNKGRKDPDIKEPPMPTVGEVLCIHRPDFRSLFAAGSAWHGRHAGGYLK